MNIAELFVRRPVMTVLVMTGILIFGLIGYRLLPVNAVPPAICQREPIVDMNPSARVVTSAVADPGYSNGEQGARCERPSTSVRLRAHRRQGSVARRHRASASMRSNSLV